MKYFVLFSFAFVIYACSTHSSRKNMPEDRNRAFWFCSAFDSLRSLNDNEGAEKMMGEELAVGDVESVFAKLDSALGKIRNWNMSSYSSDVETNNGVETGMYTITMLADYERGKATENFTISSGADHQMHIVGFHANIEL